MKTLASSMLLSVIFLSAGAFAGADREVREPQVAAAKVHHNVTTMGKNRIWPPAGQISMEPCNLRRCIEV